MEELKRLKSKLWTRIYEFEGMFYGRIVTFYDVEVIYKTTLERVGIAFTERGVLHFDLNITIELQGQGIGTEVFQRAISDYLPSQVLGYWKKADNYLGGESINLTIFREKIAKGLTLEEAAFETPTGKILKRNGFGGTPTILLNTNDEVKILFNP